MNQQTNTSSFYKKTFMLLFVLSLLLAAIAALYIKLTVIPALPDVNTLKNIQLQTPMSVYSRDGLLIAKFGEKKRIPTQYENVPSTQIKAFLAAEDKDFFQHSGVDFIGLVRAAGQLILTGEKKQGGSTITMQVARNFFLTKEKTYIRKIREILLSFIIENQLSKQEILTLYLNKIYLGHRSYGIAAAAQVYYNSSLEELSLAQQAMIAGLPKAPSAFNPITNPERALTRRNYVLNRLLKLNYITQSDFDQAIAEPISAGLYSASVQLEAPYVAEMVRNEVYNMYGDEIYSNGMHVYTTLESSHQRAANQAVKKALHQYDRRHGYRGVLGHINLDEINLTDFDTSLLSSYQKIGETEPAIVISLSKDSLQAITSDNKTIDITWENLKWASPYINENAQGKQPKTPSDILAAGNIIRIRQQPDSETFELAQVPNVSGAFVSMDPTDGALTALVGGYDFYSGKFNRAYQAKRQPGSGFKPILYAAALSKGYTPATLINDAPVVFNDAGLERQWRPENYSGKFFGPTRLRDALTHSRNLVSIRILRDIGVKYTRTFASRFGFQPKTLPNNLSLSLGSGSTNPYQMATAYSVFANGGFSVTPYFIDKIISASGEELFKANPATTIENPPHSTDEDNLLLKSTLTTLLEDTHSTENNTLSEALVEPPIKKAKRVISPQLNFIINSILRDVIKRGTGRRALSLGRTDLAGKTGTTNDQRDAWFNGFHPSLVAVAWVGLDNSKPLGNKETGGRAALPIWIDFMKEALKDTPNTPLSQPEGIVGLLIDPETGLKTSSSNQKAIFEYFREDNIPASDSQDNALDKPLTQQPSIEELF
ncbi:MAG: peptidase [Cycloclasticus sp.]|nr:peptidase [Cycloclasticus sp.]MBG95833.1 peptidase [Cycloclasticus sp.]